MTPASRLMLEELSKLAKQGLGYREAAWVLDTRPRYVANLAKKHGISFKLERRGPKPDHQFKIMNGEV